MSAASATVRAAALPFSATRRPEELTRPSGIMTTARHANERSARRIAPFSAVDWGLAVESVGYVSTPK